jgi:hypothetical protein
MSTLTLYEAESTLRAFLDTEEDVTPAQMEEFSIGLLSRKMLARDHGVQTVTGYGSGYGYGDGYGYGE